ncbi:MAG: permease [Ilumatobacteraceae bacterium]
MTVEMRSWATLFDAMVLQAMPFLVFGVVLSALVVTAVPSRVRGWVLARPVVLAIPMGAVCGMVVPGCECATVPVASRLSQRGVPFAAALSFALASPALNPIVLLATATAFAGHPEMVLARLLASMLAVLIVSSYIAAMGLHPLPTRASTHEPHGTTVLGRAVDAAQHDLLHTIGVVVIGAAAAATLRVFVPSAWLDHFSQHLTTAIPTMGVLAVLLSLCSEADAFVAASFVLFPPVAVLTFMVVGPLVDIRLFLMYRTAFGTKIACAIAGLAFGAALTAAFLIGSFLL